MRRIVAVIACAIWIGLVAEGQDHPPTGKEIYRINCGAIVQIVTESGLGVGFIISESGRVVTANHVVTTRESVFHEYAKHINVYVPGKREPYVARPVNPSPTQEQVNYDSAVIKIDGEKLPHVSLGDWAKTDIGDTVTVLSAYPPYSCLLLQGEVTAKGVAPTSLGPNLVDTILFQIPIRNGFSGSPIFDREGKVIGIEDTKVFGIAPALDELRNHWKASSRNGTVQFMGVDLAGSFVGVIDGLDQGLISGLGSGVNIRYARDLQEK